jgi:hypothetical protein
VGVGQADLARQWRARADQAHVAGKHIQQLRQLVDRGDRRADRDRRPGRAMTLEQAIAEALQTGAMATGPKSAPRGANRSTE